MRFHSSCRLAAVLLALCLAHCAGEPNPVPEYLKNTWGIRLSGFSGDYEVGGDGTQIYTSTGKTSVDGLGEKEVGGPSAKLGGIECCGHASGLRSL